LHERSLLSPAGDPLPENPLLGMWLMLSIPNKARLKGPSHREYASINKWSADKGGSG
jgi:hypothetical protein